MAYLTQKEQDQFTFKDGEGTQKSPTFYGLPKWHVIAIYMGYKLKLDLKQDRSRYDRDNRTFTIHPVYKKGAQSYDFQEHIWDIFKVFEKLKADGHFDLSIKKAWESLDIDEMVSVIYVKLKELKIK